MRVNEIFYSLQGEGTNTGRPAVFVRLSGCNLKCPFCDTDFSTFEEKTDDEIVEEVMRLGGDCRFVVITGGEPTIQDCTMLIDKLHHQRYEVAMESNGTRLAPYNVDWLTISPKVPFTEHAMPKVQRCEELKLVFNRNTESYNPVVLTFYRLDGTNCVVRLDDNAPMLVLREDVVALKEAFNTMILG
jgi:organic radical activating enzyme